MKKISIMGIVLFAILAFSALSAGSAFAAKPEWLVDAKALAGAETAHVEITGTLELSDLKTGVSLLCKGTGLGEVESVKKGRILEATATACSVDKGSCGEPLAVAQDLPWNTELTEPKAGEVRNSIKTGGMGNPGWGVECFKFIEDLCSSNEGSTLMLNIVGVPTDVTATFDELSVADCTVGGLASGEVKETVLIAALEGLDLAFS